MQHPYETPQLSDERGTNLSSKLWNEIRIKLQHRKLCRIEDLVTELAITFYAEDFKIYVSSYQKVAQAVHILSCCQPRTSARICTECKSQCVCTTLRYAVRVILLLPRFRLHNLLLIKVALVQFHMKSLQ
jgi:hypothetical protein